MAGVGFTSPRMVGSSSIWWLLPVRGLTDAHHAAACDFLVCSNRACLCFSSSFFFFFASFLWLSAHFLCHHLVSLTSHVAVTLCCYHLNASASFLHLFLVAKFIFFAFSRHILSFISSSLSPKLKDGFKLSMHKERIVSYLTSSMTLIDFIGLKTTWVHS